MKEIVKFCHRVGEVRVMVDDADYTRLLELTSRSFFMKKDIRPYIKLVGQERQLAQEVIGVPQTDSL